MNGSDIEKKKGIFLYSFPYNHFFSFFVSFKYIVILSIFSFVDFDTRISIMTKEIYIYMNMNIFFRVPIFFFSFFFSFIFWLLNDSNYFTKEKKTCQLKILFFSIVS